jgi:hypothetical protein
MQCVTCNQTKPEQEFHADNKTGWSKICKPCRDRRNQRVYTRRYRQKLKLSNEVVKANKAQDKNILTNKIYRLLKDFKRFTLLNRTAIKQLVKKLDQETPDQRTVDAYARRVEMQKEAEAIYNGQVQMVLIGITPKPINEIWRMNHGEYARSESQETNQTDIGQPSDISLLAVHVGDGESWDS